MLCIFHLSKHFLRFFLTTLLALYYLDEQTARHGFRLFSGYIQQPAWPGLLYGSLIAVSDFGGLTLPVPVCLKRQAQEIHIGQIHDSTYLNQSQPWQNRKLVSALSDLLDK
jgi:hypothetical protein